MQEGLTKQTGIRFHDASAPRAHGHGSPKRCFHGTSSAVIVTRPSRPSTSKEYAPPESNALRERPSGTAIAELHSNNPGARMNHRRPAASETARLTLALRTVIQALSVTRYPPDWPHRQGSQPFAKGAAVNEESNSFGFTRTCDKLSHPLLFAAALLAPVHGTMGMPRLVRLVAASPVLGATICRIDKAVHAI
jgi:hypothetical protein